MCRSSSIRPVREFVMNSPSSLQYRDRLTAFVDLIAAFAKTEGRSQLVIAVGCTGGHHRSVTFAELLYAHLKESYSASVSHRDILK